MGCSGSKGTATVQQSSSPAKNGAAASKASKAPASPKPKEQSEAAVAEPKQEESGTAPTGEIGQAKDSEQTTSTQETEPVKASERNAAEDKHVSAEGTGAHSDEVPSQNTEEGHQSKTENPTPPQNHHAPLAEESQNDHNSEAQPPANESKEQIQSHPVSTPQKQEDVQEPSAPPTAVSEEDQEADHPKGTASDVASSADQKSKENDPASAQIAETESKAEIDGTSSSVSEAQLQVQEQDVTCAGEAVSIPPEQVPESGFQEQPAVPSEESQTVEDAPIDTQADTQSSPTEELKLDGKSSSEIGSDAGKPTTHRASESPENVNQTVQMPAIADAKASETPEESQLQSEATIDNNTENKTGGPVLPQEQQNTSPQQMEQDIEEHTLVTDIQESVEQGVPTEQRENDSNDGTGLPVTGTDPAQAVTDNRVSDVSDTSKPAEATAEVAAKEAQAESQSGDIKAESPRADTVVKVEEQATGETPATASVSAEQCTSESEEIVAADSDAVQKSVSEPSKDAVALNKVVQDESQASQEVSDGLEQTDSSQQKALGDSCGEVSEQKENETKTESEQEKTMESASPTESAERAASEDENKVNEAAWKEEALPAAQTETTEKVAEPASDEESKDNSSKEDVKTPQTETPEKETTMTADKAPAVSQSEVIQSDAPAQGTTGTVETTNQALVVQEVEPHLSNAEEETPTEAPSVIPQKQVSSPVAAVQSEIEKAEEPIPATQEVPVTQEENTTQAGSTLADLQPPCDTASESTPEQGYSTADAVKVEEASKEKSDLPLLTQQEVESAQMAEVETSDLVQQQEAKTLESSSLQVEEVSTMVSSETPIGVEQPEPIPSEEVSPDERQQEPPIPQSAEFPELPLEASKDDEEKGGVTDAPETPVQNMKESITSETAEVQETKLPQPLDLTEITTEQQSELHHENGDSAPSEPIPAAEQPQHSDEQSQDPQQESSSGLETENVPAEGSAQEELDGTPAQESEAPDSTATASEGS